MVRFRFNSKFLALAAVMLLAFSLVVGCSSNPIGDALGAINNQQPNEPVDPKILTRTNNDLGPQLSSSELFTEQTVNHLTGATMTLFDVTLIIPPGAVDNDTTFSISIPDPALFYNDFGTHGLQFNVPVTVIMCYRDANLSNVNETSIRLAWYDEYYQSWRDMPCTVDYLTKTVTGQVDHFSSYGLISD